MAYSIGMPSSLYFLFKEDRLATETFDISGISKISIALSNVMDIFSKYDCLGPRMVGNIF